MKKEMNITATLDQTKLLEDLVEKLAYRRSDTGIAKIKMPENQEVVETSSNETYVNGTFHLSEEGSEFDYSIPFISQFLFTCIKLDDDTYKISWTSSLS